MPPLIGGICEDAGTCSTPPYGSVNTGPPRRNPAFFAIRGGPERKSVLV